VKNPWEETAELLDDIAARQDKRLKRLQIATCLCCLSFLFVGCFTILRSDDWMLPVSTVLLSLSLSFAIWALGSIPAARKRRGP